MLRADVVVIEPLRLVLSERQDLARAIGELVEPIHGAEHPFRSERRLLAPDLNANTPSRLIGTGSRSSAEGRADPPVRAGRTSGGARDERQPSERAPQPRPRRRPARARPLQRLPRTGRARHSPTAPLAVGHRLDGLLDRLGGRGHRLDGLLDRLGGRGHRLDGLLDRSGPWPPARWPPRPARGPWPPARWSPRPARGPWPPARWSRSTGSGAVATGSMVSSTGSGAVATGSMASASARLGGSVGARRLDGLLDRLGGRGHRLDGLLDRRVRRCRGRAPRPERPWPRDHAPAGRPAP